MPKIKPRTGEGTIRKTKNTKQTRQGTKTVQKTQEANNKRTIKGHKSYQEGRNTK